MLDSEISLYDLHAQAGKGCVLAVANKIRLLNGLGARASLLGRDEAVAQGTATQPPITISVGRVLGFHRLATHGLSGCRFYEIASAATRQKYQSLP